MTFLEILKNSISWNDIYKKLAELSINNERLAGKLFEEFCKYYYLNEPSVCSDYQNVWLFDEIPHQVKKKLNLGTIDHGIDLVLEGREGDFSVVQCKFKTNQNRTISWTKDRLANLFADGDKADYFIVFTNASGIDKHSLTKKVNQLKLITIGDLLGVMPSTLDAIKRQISDKKKTTVIVKKPRDYQKLAIKDVLSGFKHNDRGQLILPCGAGKTLVSLWIKES